MKRCYICKKIYILQKRIEEIKRMNSGDACKAVKIY